MNELTQDEKDFIIYCLQGQASVAGLSKSWLLELIAKVESEPRVINYTFTSN